MRAQNILWLSDPKNDDEEENNSETSSTFADVEQMYDTSDNNSSTESPTLDFTGGAINGESKNI